MSLLWTTATSWPEGTVDGLVGSHDDVDDYYAAHPEEFDHRPYSERLLRQVLQKDPQNGGSKICSCEHVDHTLKARVSEGMHPLWSATHEGHWEHPWAGGICDDCATGHMADAGIKRTPAVS